MGDDNHMYNDNEVLLSDLRANDRGEYVWHVGYGPNRDGLFVIDSCPWTLAQALARVAGLESAFPAKDGHYTEIFRGEEV